MSYDPSQAATPDAAQPDVQAPSMQSVLGGTATPPPPDVTTTPSLPTMPAPSFAPPTDGKPALWRGILSGALAGLAGSAGSTTFAGGAARGAGAELDSQRQAPLPHRINNQKLNSVTHPRLSS